MKAPKRMCYSGGEWYRLGSDLSGTGLWPIADSLGKTEPQPGDYVPKEMSHISYRDDLRKRGLCLCTGRVVISRDDRDLAKCETCCHREFC